MHLHVQDQATVAHNQPGEVINKDIVFSRHLKVGVMTMIYKVFRLLFSSRGHKNISPEKQI